MNVLVLTNAPVPYRMDFFEELGKRCSLTVMFEQTAKEQTHRNPKWFSLQGQTFKIVYLNGIKCGKKKIHFEVLNYLNNIEYDVIMVMGYSLPTEILSIIYLKKKRIPFVLCFDGTVPKQTTLVKTTIKRILISYASAYLSTGALTDLYIQRMGGDKNRIFRVPFTSLHKQDIPTSLPDEETKKYLRNKLGLRGEHIVLSVGQFIPRKGIDILIRVASYLTYTHSFYVVGDEPTQEYIDLKYRLKADNIHFLGFKNKKELSEYYTAADYFVLPTREDVWALVIPEAMSYGLPTITTDHCGAGVELIEPYFPHCIVPIDNPDAIVKALHELDIDQEYTEQNRVTNYRMMQNYTIENMVDRYIEVYRNFTEANND